MTERHVTIINCVIDHGKDVPLHIEKGGTVTLTRRSIIVDDFVFIGRPRDLKGGVCVEELTKLAVDWVNAG